MTQTSIKYQPFKFHPKYSHVRTQGLRPLFMTRVYLFTMLAIIASFVLGAVAVLVVQAYLFRQYFNSQPLAPPLKRIKSVRKQSVPEPFFLIFRCVGQPRATRGDCVASSSPRLIYSVGVGSDGGKHGRWVERRAQRCGRHRAQRQC